MSDFLRYITSRSANAARAFDRSFHCDPNYLQMCHPERSSLGPVDMHCPWGKRSEGSAFSFSLESNSLVALGLDSETWVNLVSTPPVPIRLTRARMRPVVDSFQLRCR